MKLKHNKKRNTAFVYEALVREVTVSIMKDDIETKDKAISLLKKHFKPNSLLRKHLECYRSLYETRNVNSKIYEKILSEAKMAQRLMDPHGIFLKQTDLIDDVNKELSPQVFNNFVPNYKTLATIYQIFSTDNSPKNAVILESQLVKDVCSSHTKSRELQPIDSLVMSSFVEKFNEKYSDELIAEQQNLLNLYILSFTDNSLALKSFLNEEIVRLKKELVDNYDIQEFQEDDEMKNKAHAIVEKLESFSTQPLSDEVLNTILKTQELVKELQNDGNND